MQCIRKVLLSVLALAFAIAPPVLFAAPHPQPIFLRVDATDIARKLIHAELSIPVRPGPLTLVYPKWIPGYHAPVGPINNIVGLDMKINGRSLPWRRDPLDMFAFHIVVPPATTVLNISMDVVVPSRPDAALGAATANLFVLEWNQVVLYPEGAASDHIFVHPQLRLPAGWGHASALLSEQGENGILDFPEVSLTGLVDSPLLAGKYFKTLPLGTVPPVFVDVAAESPEALNITREWVARLRRLVAAAGALFGGYSYDQYHFLLALSDELGNDGIEHRQSSDKRIDARLFSSEPLRLAEGYLLPHEYVHAWNGKYRRPIGLTKRNYQEPQTGELLWVYEGLTRYLNWVLAARSGMFSAQEARDYAALLAAEVDNRPGRQWRSLEDTAVSAQVLYSAPEHWQSLRRSVDFYDEALFLWLEVDTIIRQQSQNKRSLDDFCRSFFSPSSANSDVKPYTFDDLVAELDHIAAYDWRGFFNSRLQSTGSSRGPLNGLAASGWNLAYGDTRGSVQSAREETHATVDERFSVGLLLEKDGTILDVLRDSPAWKAGLAPGMKLRTLNGENFSAEGFRAGNMAGRMRGSPMHCLVQNGSAVFEATMAAPQDGGYPRLERDSKADMLAQILK